jgi:hypothetical protein
MILSLKRLLKWLRKLIKLIIYEKEAKKWNAYLMRIPFLCIFERIMYIILLGGVMNEGCG